LNQQKADNLLATKPDSSIYCRHIVFMVSALGFALPAQVITKRQPSAVSA